MTHEELKELLDREIAKDDAVYEEAILRALLDSGINCERILTAVMKSAKIDISKTQLRWIRDKDDERRSLRRLEEETQERIQRWKDAGETVYSVKDFPDWLITKLNRKFGSADAAAYDVAARLIREKPEYFFDESFQVIPQHYALSGGKAFFTKDGYKYLVMESVDNNWVTFAEHDQWIRDKKDLYPGAII